MPVAGPEFHARFRLADPLGFSAKGVGFGQAQRVVVTRVEPWGQADNFAVQIGDVILRVGGSSVADQVQCDGLLRSAIGAAQRTPHLVVTFMRPDGLQPAPASAPVARAPASPSVRVSRHGSVSIDRTPPAPSQRAAYAQPPQAPQLELELTEASKALDEFAAAEVLAARALREALASPSQPRAPTLASSPAVHITASSGAYPVSLRSALERGAQSLASPSASLDAAAIAVQVRQERDVAESAAQRAAQAQAQAACRALAPSLEAAASVALPPKASPAAATPSSSGLFSTPSKAEILAALYAGADAVAPANASPPPLFRATAATPRSTSSSVRVNRHGSVSVASGASAASPRVPLAGQRSGQPRMGGSIETRADEAADAAAARAAVLAEAPALTSVRGSGGLVVEQTHCAVTPSAQRVASPASLPPTTSPQYRSNVHVSRHGSVSIGRSPAVTGLMPTPRSPGPAEAARVQALPLPASVDLHPAVRDTADEIVATRRYLHTTPELGFAEHRTAAHIAAQVRWFMSGCIL